MPRYQSSEHHPVEARLTFVPSYQLSDTLPGRGRALTCVGLIRYVNPRIVILRTRLGPGSPPLGKCVPFCVAHTRISFVPAHWGVFEEPSWWRKMGGLLRAVLAVHSVSSNFFYSTFCCHFFSCQWLRIQGRWPPSDLLGQSHCSCVFVCFLIRDTDGNLQICLDDLAVFASDVGSVVHVYFHCFLFVPWLGIQGRWRSDMIEWSCHLSSCVTNPIDRRGECCKVYYSIVGSYIFDSLRWWVIYAASISPWFTIELACIG